MKLYKLTGLVLAVALVAACAMPLTEAMKANSWERYQSAVNSWRGADVGELLAAWPANWRKGPPEQEGDAWAYSFIWTEEIYRQADQYYDHAHQEWVDRTPAGAELLICETVFIADSQGLITGLRPGNYQCGDATPPPPRVR
ncbi:MAG: hypothetical protein LBV79_10860 [Candidatus Adiutrix sp.]|nr:hypothetical protein [Candidatus Adiutrix sp.]